MICTTTNTIEGHNIIDYRGIVFGEVVEGVSFSETSDRVSEMSLEDEVQGMKISSIYHAPRHCVNYKKTHVLWVLMQL